MLHIYFECLLNHKNKLLKTVALNGLYNHYHNHHDVKESLCQANERLNSGNTQCKSLLKREFMTLRDKNIFVR